MLNYEHFAVTMGRAVETFRRGSEAVPEQKVALRTLAALVRLGGVLVEVVDGELHLDGAPVAVTLPGVRVLLTPLDCHDVHSLRLARGAAPAGLLHLLRALATPYGGFPPDEDPESRLRAAGVTDIQVVVERRRRATPDPAHRTSAPTPEPGGDAVAEAAGGAGRLSRPEAAVASIALDPAAADLTTRLATAADGIRQEVLHGRPSGAVRALAQLLQLAESGSEPTSTAVRDTVAPLLTRELFHGAAECTRAEANRMAANRVLLAGGGVATEVVRERLLTATTPEDRRHYFDLLCEQADGLRYLLMLLQHTEPAIAQRTAEVVGELEVREAVPLLQRVALHPVPTVRTAVLRALARMGTSQAIETLGEMLVHSGDGRVDAARAIGDVRLEVLIPEIERVARRERDPETLAELGRALGRIGTPEAVTVLTQWAQPAGWRFWQRRVARRVAAVDGLRLAGGGGAIGVLQSLTADRDPEVLRAATEALEDLSIAAGTRHP